MGKPATATQKPFSWPVRIYYEDTDASGVVYHANYLKYFERARTEWLRRMGFDQVTLIQDHQVAFTVAALDVVFYKPARLDDELSVTVSVIRIGRASMNLAQNMHLTHQADTLIATLTCKVGCVDTVNFKPTAMPAVISKEMQGVS